MGQVSAPLYDLYQNVDLLVGVRGLKVALHQLLLRVWEHALSSDVVQGRIDVLQVENEGCWLGASPVHADETVQQILEFQL